MAGKEIKAYGRVIQMIHPMIQMANNDNVVVVVLVFYGPSTLFSSFRRGQLT